MAVNRYSQPAQADFINTYVPINFGELYRIGTTQKAAVDQAAANLQNNIQKWSEFQSPSAVDTKRYYDLTIGSMKDYITELAGNPDLLKTQEGRSRLQSMINNVDYNALSNLKQSRDAMLQRQKVDQQLMLSDKYNPLWHKVDYTGYDTQAAGTFNDVSPLAYKSEVDIVKPFVDNLKPGFIRNQGGWEYKGVSEARTREEVDKNISSILNTPQAQKHIEVLQQQGLSPEEATNQFVNSIYRAAKEFAYEDRERDPWFLKSMELAARKAAKEQTPTMLNNLTTMIHNDSRKKLLENFSGLSQQAVQGMLKGQELTPEQKDTLMYNMSPDVIQNKLKSGFLEVAKNKKNLNAGAKWVLDVVSAPLSPSANNIYAKDGSTEKLSDNTFLANDSRNFILADNLAYAMMGTSRNAVLGRDAAKNPLLRKSIIARDKFNKLWESGDRFNGFIVKGEGRTITDGGRVYHVKNVFIPADQLSDFTTEDKGLIGKLVRQGDIGDSETLSTVSELDDEGNVIDRKTKRTRTKSDNASLYLKVQVVTPIADEGERAIEADNIYTKKTRGLSSKQTDIQAEISEYERL